MWGFHLPAVPGRPVPRRCRRLQPADPGLSVALSTASFHRVESWMLAPTGIPRQAATCGGEVVGERESGGEMGVAVFGPPLGSAASVEVIHAPLMSPPSHTAGVPQPPGGLARVVEERSW